MIIINIILYLSVVDLMADMTNCLTQIFVFPPSWDNGENEKLSPWDVEPIPDNGN